MDKSTIESIINNYIRSCSLNRISKEYALSEELIGMQMYDTALIGICRADDPLFELFKENEDIIGSHYILPSQWLSGAASVISIFIPFTEDVKKSNKPMDIYPSDQWLHARIEGQIFINTLTQYLSDELTNRGYGVCAPSLDKRFKSGSDKTPYTSNWSERHTAFACGLGTFGLSKGIITEKGMAGRFTSIITTAQLEPTGKNYSDPYEYCTLCGKCVKNCPPEAISLDKGKNHPICSQFLDTVRDKYSPRYGCGKCQTYVPCEHSIPRRKGGIINV